MTRTPIRVVLVDDVDDVRHLVRTALRVHGGFEVVGEASTGAEAIDLAGDLRPEVIVLDLGLPDLAGQEVVAQIRDESPTTQVVVLSGAEPSDRSWFEERTAGYLLKDAGIDHLVELLARVGRRDDDVRTLDIPHDPIGSCLARELVRETLAEWAMEDLLDEAELVVSELVTNAVTHGGSACRLELSHSSGALRIEVTDEGTGSPEPQPFDAEAEHGRGLVLVSAMSTSWGVEAAPAGKKVWADLAVG